jgi:hypothetical protein
MHLTELQLPDPRDDPQLDAIPDSIRNQIAEVADAVLQEGHCPTPPLVADVMKRLAVDVNPEWLRVMLMTHWRFRLDEIDPLDIEALHTHWQQAPVIDHPWRYYLAGLITGLTLSPIGGRARPRDRSSTGGIPS